MNTIHELCERLLADARQKADAICAEARAQGEVLQAEALARARAEGEVLEAACRAQADTLLERGELHEKLEMRHMLLQTRQEVIDQVVSNLYERFTSQSDAQWVALLCHLLSRYEGEERPRIVVPARLRDAVCEALGADYTVVPTGMKHGFLFSFANYDMNFEAERLFTYRRAEFERAAAALLFGGDDDA